METNCIYRVCEDAKNIFYRVNDSLKILREIEESNKKDAAFSTKNTLKISKKSIKPPKQDSSKRVKKWLENMNQRQRNMLKYLQEKKYITVKEYMEVAQISPATVRVDLKLFKKNKFVEQIGKTRNTEYHWNPK